MTNRGPIPIPCEVLSPEAFNELIWQAELNTIKRGGDVHVLHRTGHCAANTT